MSKTFGFFRNRLPRGNATSSTYPEPVYSNINLQLSNVAYANFTDTLTITMNTNLTNNQTFYMVLDGANANVFSDGLNYAAANVSANGSLSISKNIQNFSNVSASEQTFTVKLRTSDPVNGQILYTSNTLYIRNQGNVSLQTVSAGSNTNVNIYSDSGYDFAIATITSNVSATSAIGSANIRAVSANATTVPIRYLIVGGGGAAGETLSANVGLNDKGGGAGGAVSSGSSNITVNTSYPLTVGNGGRGAFNYSTTYDATRAYGNSSTFLGITSVGGGAGGWYLQAGRTPGGGGGPSRSGGSAGSGIFAGGAGRVWTNVGITGTIRFGGGGGGNGGIGWPVFDMKIGSNENEGGFGGPGRYDNILLSDYYWGAGGAGSGYNVNTLAKYWANQPGDPSIPSFPNQGQQGTNGVAASNVGRGGGLYGTVGNDGFHGVVIARVPKYIINITQT